MADKKINQEALKDCARIMAFAFMEYWEKKDEEGKAKCQAPDGQHRRADLGGQKTDRTPETEVDAGQQKRKRPDRGVARVRSGAA